MMSTMVTMLAQVRQNLQTVEGRLRYLATQVSPLYPPMRDAFDVLRLSFNVNRKSAGKFQYMLFSNPRF
jgi:hypothetical protein